MTSRTPHPARLDRDTVLVISGEDATAKAVMAELEHHAVEALLLDIGDFPSRQSLAAATTDSGAWSGRLRGRGVEVDLSRVRSVFYRRPTKFSIPEGVSASDAVLAEYEARLGLGGVLASLDCLWLCHPHAVARAEYKPLQLKALREAGLAVPRTLITNDHAVAVEWARTISGPIVCKQLSPVALEQDYASIRYEPFHPPADVRTYLEAMGLRYGCFDLVATSEGMLAYECNPAGQYLWLERAIGLPISAGIAALLATGTG